MTFVLADGRRCTLQLAKIQAEEHALCSFASA